MVLKICLWAQKVTWPFEERSPGVDSAGRYGYMCALVVTIASELKPNPH